MPTAPGQNDHQRPRVGRETEETAVADAGTVEQRLAFMYQWLTQRDEPLDIDVDDFMNEVHSIVHQARREAVAVDAPEAGFVELTEVVAEHLTCQARPSDGRTARPANAAPVPYAMTCGADLPGDCGPRGTFQAAHVADRLFASYTVSTR